MESLELLGVFIVVFITYLYLPVAIFNFGAEQYIDLGTRRDTGELKEFVDAAIPSFALNLLTVGILRIPCVLGFHYTPEIDWKLIAAIVTQDRPTVKLAILSGFTLTFCYLCSLLTVSVVSGLMYGKSYRELASRKDPKEPVFRQRKPKPPTLAGAAPARGLAKSMWYAVKYFAFGIVELARAANFHVAQFFKHEELLILFKWQVTTPTLIVRTGDDRMIFGKLLSFDSSRSGQILHLTLSGVKRYCATEEERERALVSGRLPFADLGGSLTILWDQVASIHEADESHFEAIETKFKVSRKRYLAGSILAACANENLSLQAIWTRLGGSDYFSEADYAEALEFLLGDRGPDLPRATAIIVKRDDGDYVFPVRSQAAAPSVSSAEHATELGDQRIPIMHRDATASSSEPLEDTPHRE